MIDLQKARQELEKLRGHEAYSTLNDLLSELEVARKRLQDPDALWSAWDEDEQHRFLVAAPLYPYTAEISDLRRKVAKLEFSNEMACDEPPAGCTCSGCSTARERAEKGEL